MASRSGSPRSRCACRALIERALATPGFHGVLGYTLREALWLEHQSISDDIVIAYPTVDRAALEQLVGSPSAASRITLMVDDVAQLDVVDSVRSSHAVRVRVALDIDAGLRMGSQHVGPKRSPLHDTEDVLRLARHVTERAGFTLVGVMTYEGQVAGVPDDVPSQRAKSLVVRRLKSASMAQLAERRRVIADRLADLVELEFWNGGGSGSVEATAADGAVTEIAAGSGLLVPGLFDHYQSFSPRPASFYGLPVTRHPSPTMATVHGGGLIASGSDRWRPRTDPVGAARAPPDRARGRRRGADPADRLPGRDAADRRPGVVPAREVRRAVRAHQHRAAAGRRRLRRRGADLPRVRERLVSNAAEVLELALSRSPTLGTGRLVCVDGPAGSGKTTLAEEVASLSGAPVIHMDDLFEGWDGLPHVNDQLDTLLPPLATGLAGELPAVGLAGTCLGRDRRRTSGTAPGARGRRVGCPRALRA